MGYTFRLLLFNTETNFLKSWTIYTHKQETTSNFRDFISYFHKTGTDSKVHLYFNHVSFTWKHECNELLKCFKVYYRSKTHTCSFKLLKENKILKATGDGSIKTTPAMSTKSLLYMQ